MSAPRSIWNGSVTFGSVVVPVKLFTATEDRTLRFREVRESDGSPIEHKRVGAESGEEIPFKEIEKAYDTGGGQIVKGERDNGVRVELAGEGFSCGRCGRLIGRLKGRSGQRQRQLDLSRLVGLPCQAPIIIGRERNRLTAPGFR